MMLYDLLIINFYLICLLYCICLLGIVYKVNLNIECLLMR